MTDLTFVNIHGQPVSTAPVQKFRATRGKPYEIHSAAVLCMQMAQKEGWLRVQVVELSSAQQ